MLVLTRKPEQTIVINGDIEVVVLEVRGEQVRLGINAPKEISVHRKEILSGDRMPGVPRESKPIIPAALKAAVAP